MKPRVDLGTQTAAATAASLAQTEAEIRSKRRAANAKVAAELATHLRATGHTRIYRWGTLTTYVVPSRPDVFRAMVALLTCEDPDSPVIDAKVAGYQTRVTAQNAASAKQRSAAEYLEIGYLMLDAERGIDLVTPPIMNRFLDEVLAPSNREAEPAAGERP